MSVVILAQMRKKRLWPSFSTQIGITACNRQCIWPKANRIGAHTVVGLELSLFLLHTIPDFWLELSQLSAFGVEQQLITELAVRLN